MGKLAIIMTDFKEIAGKERGLYPINNRPVMEYVLESIPDEVEEIMISVRGEKEAEAYGFLADKFLARIYLAGNKMIGTQLASIMEESQAQDTYLVLPCDAPLLKIEYNSFLFDVCRKFSAAIPRTSDDKRYYLFSSYRSEEFLSAYYKASSPEMDEIVSKMRNVLFINVNALKIFDDKLNLLLRVTSVEEAKRAERIIRSKDQ
ncbi:MAG: NTP transferase domain-containing protein [Halobacteria archaeon]